MEKSGKITGGQFFISAERPQNISPYHFRYMTKEDGKMVIRPFLKVPGHEKMVIRPFLKVPTWLGREIQTILSE
jgi:hypothetical protein